MPETISTTSSYTIRVAVRSGSKSRLMEENTGTHTGKHTQTALTDCLLSHYEFSQTANPPTIVIIVRQNKSLHLSAFLIVLLSSCPVCRAQVDPADYTSFPFLPSFHSPIVQSW